MALYLVTYDVKEPHQTAVKENLKDHWFLAALNMGSVALPDTTLVFDAASGKDAEEKFLRLAVQGLPAGEKIITRYFVTAVSADCTYSR
ncbi:hypothetical protein [Myxococcus virescens]|uniref:YCII-related domain-containing protein n=1 Tax=Myxococcus virescens TaxID=83456 RepID=A0A511HNN7_9BACT|nr:hypothetical protein [Myxococcus virescens]GEL75200.1 hypothetical protein MVI01_69840 [Myxococcus virescens]SDD65089.1 hypothetical protein SAMN04488504_102125 [Myxococcus virescens]